MLHGTLSSDGTSDTYKLKKKMSSVHVHTSGTFGGGTITLQFFGLDEAWHPVANGAFTSAVDKVADLPRGTLVRFSLSGATSPSLYYQLVERENS